MLLKPKVEDEKSFAAALPPLARPHASALLESAQRHAPANLIAPVQFATLLAAIIDHESRWGALLKPKGPGGTGDNGNGLGLGQIDRRYHGAWAASAAWWEPAVNIDKAAEVFAAKVRRFPGNIDAAVAAYNASEERVATAIANGAHPQSVTTRKAYVDEVAARLAFINARATA